MLVESLLLSGVGAVLGLAFASWGSRALVAQLSTSVNRVFLDLSLDWRVMAFTAATAIATAVLFGTAPAFRAARVVPVDALKEHGRGTAVGGGSSVLVVAQVALSLILVVAAGLFIRSLEELASVPLGFDRDRVLVVNVDTAHVQTADVMSLYHRLVAALAAVPGVAQAAGSASTPVSAGLPRNIAVSGAPPTSEILALSVNLSRSSA